jgi:hypothetical protein
MFLLNVLVYQTGRHRHDEHQESGDDGGDRGAPCGVRLQGRAGAHARQPLLEEPGEQETGLHIFIASL